LGLLDKLSICPVASTLGMVIENILQLGVEVTGILSLYIYIYTYNIDDSRTFQASIIMNCETMRCSQPIALVNGKVRSAP